MDALAIIWPLAVVLIWGAVFGITLLLVRTTTRDQQTVARAGYAVEDAALRAAPEPAGAAVVAAAASQRAAPPHPAT